MIGVCERHLIKALLTGDWTLGTAGNDVPQEELVLLDQIMKQDVTVSIQLGDFDYIVVRPVTNILVGSWGVTKDAGLRLCRLSRALSV